ncbi:hypothetical protein Pst134EA_032600 [Puccinia striiformis f. sp. tritici]|uniref:uncharacterized protein n=1 Tax=Puccinia striiformis f. sp. tritici TaxID=168172 RepID=UPI0020083B71|nr:uncharacterized protein Pst134EA_032600 [Puccinia striiformis f. sp. tritici]KAH9441695.1 hypothetical protein Pst134EA_032600 [Puccinia striiformis f. sp. tritici]
MRVAVGIHGTDVEKAIRTYNLMSEKYFTHASPTIFNAGTPHPQLSSCFLVANKSIRSTGIYDTLKNLCHDLQSAGGIGLHILNIRATFSYISGTIGHSNGIVPMLRVFNNTARYVDQGGNKETRGLQSTWSHGTRTCSTGWTCGKNHGKEESRGSGPCLRAMDS